MSDWGTIETDADAEPTGSRSRHKRHWILLLLLVVAVALLALTPPLLNVNRYQRRIATSISQSLGRPGHLDRVSLHLLPMPGFRLENLVVSEDPHFGSEPIIRANIVEATLRPASLWRRHVEFSTIRFVEPSLNLVRDADGTWNLESLLRHAAQIDAAPTGQPQAGPSPRFPYIEATEGRLNLKMGAEKTPFSLTEADFALWLPSPRQWRVRLEARPARTDTNISDPGILRLEGSFQRADTLAAVPVDLTLTWRDAPLGEGSRMLTGEDAEWRGTLHLDVAMTGQLGKANLGVHGTVDELRRADFLPAHPMDLSVRCTGVLSVTSAILQSGACGIATPAAHGFDKTGAIEARVERVDLPSLNPASVSVSVTHVPDNYLLEWVKLFSQRMQTVTAPDGAVSASGQWVPGADGQPGWWTGEAHGELGPASTANPILAAPSVAGTPQGFSLGALNVAPAGAAPLVFSGLANRTGYTFTLAGAASGEELRGLIAIAPPLGDGLDQALAVPGSNRASAADVSATSATGIGTANPSAPAPDPAKVLPVNLTCGRPWGGPQTCSALSPPPAARTHGRRRHASAR
jgi:hypothetical protein